MRKSLIITLFFALILGPFCPIVMAKTADASMMGMHHAPVKAELALQADHTSCLASTTHDSNAATVPLLEWSVTVCPDMNCSLVLPEDIFATYSLVPAQEAPNILDHHCSHKRE